MPKTRRAQPKRRKPQTIEPGLHVWYRDKPMLVIRIGDQFGTPHVWLAPRTTPYSLDDVIRVQSSELEIE